MMPRKVVMRRAPSPRVLHQPTYLFGCPGFLRWEFRPGMIYEVCDRCGRHLGKWAVIPTPPEPQLKSPWVDPDDDDETDIQEWIG